MRYPAFDRDGPRARRAYRLALPFALAAVLGITLLPGTSAARPQSSPKSTAPPTILGAAVVHNTLTATPGSWSGSAPIAVAYRWLRCPRDGGGPTGSGCTQISHASKATYEIRYADLGLSLKVAVTASNADGSAAAVSSSSATIAAAGQQPASRTAPAIAGRALVGQTLTAVSRWTAGARPISFGYQWWRCDRTGMNCGDISGATAKSYRLQTSDVGDRLRVRVTLSNSVGTTWSASMPTAVVTAPPASPKTPPRNTGEPRILGTPIVGNTLTATNGTWSGTTPMTFAYQWRRCPKDGGAPDASNCGVIPDAAKSAYRVRSADVGYRLRVRVTAANAEGSATAASNPTDAVRAAATRPANTSLPTISGTPVVGQTLTAGPGSWSGTQPITFVYQWRRCDQHGGSCSDIGGAGGRTYALKQVDLGNTLRVQVTARNSAGFSTTSSPPTAVISAAPKPHVPGCPSGSGTVQVGQISSPARLVVDGLQVTPSVVTRGTMQIVARFHVSACQGRSVRGALVYATTVPFNQFSIPPEQPTGADGWATLTMSRLSGFPAARHQQLLVMFVRARKPGENVLAGISTRRLISFRVDLSR